MPSPFPGMDPYLEDPEIFPDLHIGLIFSLQGLLQQALPSPYFAASGRRVWIEAARRHVEPDVDVLHPANQTNDRTESNRGIALLQETGAHPVIVTVPKEEHWEPYLDIIGTRRGKEILVTSVEIISPSNKTRRSAGRKKYKKKQREMIRSKVNLVEMDLLRGGTHTTAVPLDYARKEAGPFDYHVSIRPSGADPDYHIYPIRLEAPLPKLAIPLLPGDPFVTIDLQVAFTRAYDNGPYSRQINYATEQPVPALPSDRAAWATTLLREKGMLPSTST